MQGLKDLSQNKYIRKPLAIGSRNLEHLTRNIRGGPAPNNERNEALQERLEELLVFEIKRDGTRNYLTLSVRGLYRHVLATITSRGSTGVAPQMAEMAQMPNLTRERTNAPENVLSNPLPLGQALTVKPPSRRRHRTTSIGGNELGHIPEDGQASAPQSVTYRERLGGYLHPRDMRRLVTPFSSTNEPELIVRRHVMLLNFDPLRAIILRDRLLVLVPDGADSLLNHLEQRVRGGTMEVEESIFGHDDVSDSVLLPDNGDRPPTVLDSAARHPKKNRLKRLLRKGADFLHLGDAEDGATTAQETSKREAAESTDGNESELDILEDDDNEDDDDEDDSEWNEMAGRDWIDLPYELQCADACLYIVCSLLSEDTHELQEATLNYIQRILKSENSLQDDPLTIIRAVKDAVREMTGRVKGFVQSMNRILDEDEDMALMNLSRLLTHPERFIQPVPPEVLEEESDEPELILEAHLQTALTLMNSLDLIKGQIDTASELLDQRLDSARNRILFANMLISTLSFCVASASLVGSFFGMNLENKLEADPNAFIQVTFGALAGAFLLGCLIMVLLIYSGTIPRVRLTADV